MQFISIGINVGIGEMLAEHNDANKYRCQMPCLYIVSSDRQARRVTSHLYRLPFCRHTSTRLSRIYTQQNFSQCQPLHFKLCLPNELGYKNHKPTNRMY